MIGASRWHPGLRALCAACLLLAATACWIDSVAHEVDPLIPQRPPTVEDWQRAAADAGTAGAGVVPGEGGGDALVLPELDQLPTVSSGSIEPPAAVLALAPGGLRVAAARTDGDLAWLRLTVPNRTLPASRVALAALTARLIAEAPPADRTLSPLREAIESAGGELTVDVDFRTTRFTIAVPKGGWRWILRRLVDSARATPEDFDRIAEERERVVRDLTIRYADSPMDAAIERISSFESSGPAKWIAQAQNLTPTQVAQFHHDAYRASGSVIAARVPDTDPEQVLNLIREITAEWAAREPRLLPDPVAALPAAQGVFWAESPGTSEVSLLLDAASTSAAAAAARLTALEILTSSGTGGRIGRALREATSTPIEFRPRVVSNGVHRRLELTATFPADAVPMLQKAIKAALRSCVQSPPNLDESMAAAGRARLRLAADLRDPERWLDEITRAFIGGARPDVMLDENGAQPFEGEAPHPWLTVLQALSRPAEIDTRPIFEEWSKQSPLIIVIGGTLEPFPSAKDFQRLRDAFLPEAQREAIEASPQEQEESAREYLQRALAAAGGKDRLADLHGYQSAGVTRSGRGPSVREQLWYRDDGNLRLVRRVLATSIETVVRPERATESATGESVPLTADDVRPLLDMAHRHPLLLLAEIARGTAKYRLVSIRPLEDRQMAVLERISATSDRVRMEVDAQSGLIRAVVSTEQRELGGVFLREEYRDYRTVNGGLRAPFYRATLVDDGAVGLTTEWESFVAGAPPDDELRATIDR